MSRVPIRVRLTATFSIAMLLMLTAAALFVYVRLRDDLDDHIRANLRARAIAAVDAYRHGAPIADVALDDKEESFVQVLDTRGRVVETAGRLRGPAFTGDGFTASLHREITLERTLPGIDGAARLTSRTVGTGPDRVVIVIGQSLVDRRDALSSVVTSFVIGGIAAVVIASGIGYALARAGLAPVDAMRRRAREVSFGPETAELPLPHAHDEIRRLGETLNEMLDRLRESYTREQRFVADASHELRTPVAVIRTELEGALAAGDHQPDVHAALVAAVEECARLGRLADDLLLLARAADGGLPLRCEPVALAPIATAAVDQFALTAARDSRALRVQIDSVLAATVDPVRIRQLITNLVDNALRHGAGAVTVAASCNDTGIELTVSDEGRGFASDFVTHAFERFTRADGARGTDGAGLGLALVAAIATAHDGTAVIDGDHRATVRVAIPRSSRTT